MRRPDAALLVMLGGVSAALHVGKLATALPVLREQMGVSLVEAGFLLSLVQLAGMVLGLAVGLAADTLGLKRTMTTGLLLLSAASAVGAAAPGVEVLMLARAAEGLGFLLAAMPAPGLIRRLVPPSRVSAAMGLWGAYMPFGTAAALLAGPFVIARLGWQGWWLLLAVLSALMAAWLMIGLPPDPEASAGGRTDRSLPWRSRLGRVLRSAGPWLTALAFAVYSAQWLSLVGFLPTVFAQAGLASAAAGAATALAAAVNVLGNVASGRLLQRGWAPGTLLQLGFLAMAAGGLTAFEASLSIPWRCAGAVVFSMFGGLVPGTLFSLAVRVAPGEDTVSATVGWMQQWSAFGQFIGPPLVAWVAALAGGWQWSGVVTALLAAAGMGMAHAIGRLLPRLQK